MDALIIAAGQGSRLKEMGPSKPLVPLLGKPLIQHVMERAYLGGVSRFIVVLGYRAKEMKAALQKIAGETGLQIETVIHDQWRGGNGLSVLAAKDLLKERFLLTMSDHMFDPKLVRGLRERSCREGELVLAVDRRLQNPLVDMDDVTRVATKDGLIVNIRKHLETYDCFDTGVFSVDPSLFDCLEVAAAAGDESLSAGVKTLASKGLAAVHDIGDCFWIDVDDAAMFAKARQAMTPAADEMPAEPLEKGA